MKRRIYLITTLLVILLCLSALLSCGTPATDAETARKALKDNGYTIDDFDIETNYTSVEAYKYEDDKYNTIEIYYCKDEKTANAVYAELQEELDDDIKKLLLEYRSALNDAKEYGASQEELNIYNHYITAYESMELNREGNIVWLGTPDAVSDAN